MNVLSGGGGNRLFLGKDLRGLRKGVLTKLTSEINSINTSEWGLGLRWGQSQACLSPPVPEAESPRPHHQAREYCLGIWNLGSSVGLWEHPWMEQKTLNNRVCLFQFYPSSPQFADEKSEVQEDEG